MVEYSVGIGCVLAAGFLVLGGIGFIAADVARQVLLNINDPNAQVPDASPGSFGGIFANGISSGTPPWQPQ
jgi:hypothetical protein